MKVYFVRHGESILNGKNIHQLPSTPLSKKGVIQAQVLATRFSSIPVEIVLTSTHARALQTAQEIMKHKSVPLIESELLIERKMPSEFDGRAEDEPDILKIHNEIREHFEIPGGHYSDEENFTDLKKRAKAVFELLNNQQKESLAVVTHGYLLVILIN